MDRLIALPSYDVVAYLMVGLVALAACDLIYGTRVVIRHDWNVGVGTLTVIAAYVVGHMISSFSGTVFEQRIVVNVMERPVVHLLPPPPRPKEQALQKSQSQSDKKSQSELACIPILTCNYFNPESHLHPKIVAKKPPPDLKEFSDVDYRTKWKIHVTEVYWEAYNTAKLDKEAYGRIVTFLQLYSFCRNLSFAAFLAAIALSIQMLRRCWSRAPAPRILDYGFPRWLSSPAWQLVAFVVVGLVFFNRFLYMYRAHAIEVLTSYAYAGSVVVLEF